MFIYSSLGRRLSRDGDDDDDGFGKEPDFSLKPFGCSGSMCPTIVVEVAYRNESVARLEGILLNWVSYPKGAQYAIGIKIFPSEDLNKIQV